MVTSGEKVDAAPVDEPARAHGVDAWRLALVAGADPAAATRAALHAVVIAAVNGGGAAERPAILALARSWALSSPGAGRTCEGDEPVARSFWALPEPRRAALWCRDALGLSASEVDRVLGRALPPAAVAMTRGCMRRAACRHHRLAAAGTGCEPVANVLSRVLAGHAPAGKVALVDQHTAGCQDCAGLLRCLRDPIDAIEASMPPAPDLAIPARRAWRTHVGAPNHSLAERLQRAAEVVGSRQRPVAAVLALATAGSFGSATSQLAASSEGPAAAVAVAPLVTPVPVPRQAPPITVKRRQAVIPPLAGDVVLDPGLAGMLTPDLAEVALPVTPPPPAPAVPPPAPAPAALALEAEPPPAVALPSSLVEIDLPLPIPLQVSVDVDCPAIVVGPLRLSLPCPR